MTKNKALPLLFKLKYDGRVVGFELHQSRHKDGPISILHSSNEDPTGWKFAMIGDCWIRHDEKCQATGKVDRNNKIVFFGDMLLAYACDSLTISSERVKNGEIYLEAVLQDDTVFAKVTGDSTGRLKGEVFRDFSKLESLAPWGLRWDMT